MVSAETQIHVSNMKNDAQPMTASLLSVKI